MLGGLGLGPVASGGRFPLWSPHPSPTQALASCLPGDVWQERVARLGGWVGVVRSISLYPPLRVTGCLATCLFLARCPGPGHPLAHPRTRPRSHAAMQPCRLYLSRGNSEAAGVRGDPRMGNVVLPPSLPLRVRLEWCGELSGSGVGVRRKVGGGGGVGVRGGTGAPVEKKPGGS